VKRKKGRMFGKNRKRMDKQKRKNEKGIRIAKRMKTKGDY